jgi:hypothetical protein
MDILAISDIEIIGCIISETLASVYVKLGDVGDTGAVEEIVKSLPKSAVEGATGTTGEVQLGTPSVASLVNSCELV